MRCAKLICSTHAISSRIMHLHETYTFFSRIFILLWSYITHHHPYASTSNQFFFRSTSMPYTLYTHNNFTQKRQYNRAYAEYTIISVGSNECDYYESRNQHYDGTETITTTVLPASRKNNNSRAKSNVFVRYTEYIAWKALMIKKSNNWRLYSQQQQNRILWKLLYTMSHNMHEDIRFLLSRSFRHSVQLR